MGRTEAVEAAATALGHGHLTPDQRTALESLWNAGHSQGWNEGYDQGTEDYDYD